MAENTAESVHKGDRLLIHGRLVQHDYETRDGDKRTTYELHADEIAVSLLHATATSKRASRSQQQRKPEGGIVNDDPGPSRRPDPTRTIELRGPTPAEPGPAP